jgi:hypothetical protein
MIPPFDLKELKALAPEDLQEKLVVAGGYLADPCKACDIDLWLLAGREREDQDAIMTEVHNHLAPTPFDPEMKREGYRTYQVHPFGEIPREYEDSLRAKKIYFVGTFQKEGWPLPVQFFVTPYNDVQDLLEDFDISTHQVAQRLALAPGEGPQLFLPRWLTTTSAVTVAPRVTNWTTPSTTLARLEKLCRRYGFAALDSHPDLSRLRSLVSGQHQTAT